MEEHLHQRSQVIDDEELIMNNKIVLEDTSDDVEEGLKFRTSEMKIQVYLL